MLVQLHWVCHIFLTPSVCQLSQKLFTSRCTIMIGVVEDVGTPTFFYFHSAQRQSSTTVATTASMQLRATHVTHARNQQAMQEKKLMILSGQQCKMYEKDKLWGRRGSKDNFSKGQNIALLVLKTSVCVICMRRSSCSSMDMVFTSLINVNMGISLLSIQKCL